MLSLYNIRYIEYHYHLIIILMIFATYIEGIFPVKWTKSVVCPVHKIESKYLKENYRPIPPIRILGKIFEQVIFDSI